jgi:excisionase family DNA binding protein
MAMAALGKDALETQMRPEVQSLLASLAGIATTDLPALLGELEVVRATALLKMAAPNPTELHDELLCIEEAAARLGVSRDYLYRHSAKFPFTRRLGRKLLFSSLGIDKHIRQRG